jgi:hypothetical protein
MKMKPPTPLAEMTPERLNAELMVSLRQMLAHESWRFGDWTSPCVSACFLISLPLT